MPKSREEDYYESIRNRLQTLLETRTPRFHLEITAESFSRQLKAEVNPDIIWHFLQERKTRPDITGFVKRDDWPDFIVVEVKKDEIKLDDIYQTRKYTDLFDAKLAFLVSLQPIPGEMKRLHKARYSLLAFPSWRQTLVLAHFSDDTNDFVEWYPENPFEKDLYWD